MKSMCVNNINLLNYLLSNFLAENFDNNELNVIGNFLELLGQTLITISAQNVYCNKKNSFVSNEKP